MEVFSKSGGRTLVNGTVYAIKKGRTLVGGTEYDISFGTPISSLAVGSIVNISVNGLPREFIVVHQGNPSPSLYDASCNGTWLLMKDVYTKMAWDKTNDDYPNSDIHTYLNGTFLNLFETRVKNTIKQVKIPYKDYQTKNPMTGVNGLSTKVFPLAVGELNPTSGYNDGCACLSYFYYTGSETDATRAKRIAYMNGVATSWWGRSKHPSYTSEVNYIQAGGWDAVNKVTNTHGVRPAFIVSSDTLIDPDTFEIL